MSSSARPSLDRVLTLPPAPSKAAPPLVRANTFVDPMPSEAAPPLVRANTFVDPMPSGPVDLAAALIRAPSAPPSFSPVDSPPPSPILASQPRKSAKEASSPNVSQSAESKSPDASQVAETKSSKKRERDEDTRHKIRKDMARFDSEFAHAFAGVEGAPIWGSYVEDYNPDEDEEDDDKSNDEDERAMVALLEGSNDILTAANRVKSVYKSFVLRLAKRRMIKKSKQDKDEKEELKKALVLLVKDVDGKTLPQVSRLLKALNTPEPPSRKSGNDMDLTEPYHDEDAE